MKMLTKITALIMAVAMILLVLPILPIQAADITKAKLTYIKGDSNRDRVLNEADIDVYFNMVKGTVAAPSADELSKISIVSDSTVTMEDVRRIARVVDGTVQASTLYKSQQEIQQYIDAFFTDLGTEIGKTDDALKDDYLQDFYDTAKEQSKDMQSKYLTQYVNIFGDTVKTVAGDKTAFFEALYNNMAAETDELRNAGMQVYFNSLGDAIKAEPANKSEYLSIFFENIKKETGDLKDTQLQNYFDMLTADIDKKETADKAAYLTQITELTAVATGELVHSVLTYYFAVLTELIGASTDKAVKDGYLDEYFNTILTKGNADKAAYFNTYFSTLKGVVDSAADKSNYMDRLTALINNTAGDTMHAAISCYLGIIAELFNAAENQTDKDARLAEYFSFVNDKGADKKNVYFLSYLELLKIAINASADKTGYFDRLSVLIDSTTGDAMHTVISYNLEIIAELFNAAANKADKEARLAEYFEFVVSEGADKKADYFGSYFGLLKSLIEAPQADKTEYYDELGLLLDNIIGTFRATVLEYYLALINDSIDASENDAEGQKYAKLYVDMIKKYGDTLTFFNDLVNVIKTDEFKKKDNKISYFLRTTTTTETKNFKFAGLNESQLGDIKKLYDEEMDGETVEYSELRDDLPIRNSNVPCFNEAYISALTSSDVNSVNVEYGVDCKILADGGYGDTYTRTATDKSYNIVRYNKTIPNTIKMTVNLKQETKASIEALPTAENGGKTILMRGYGIDAREILAEFPHEEKETVENLMTMTMAMDCNNLTTDCTVEFYFDSVTFEPIAAHYTTKIVSYQHVDIVVNLFPTLLVPQGIKITGKFDPTSTSVYDNYYFFDGAYPAPAAE